MEKFSSSKALLKTAGGENAPPAFSPGSAPALHFFFLHLNLSGN